MSLHPLELEEPNDVAVKSASVPIQQRVTANLLKSFMEQSNIRWVELISAALIVICSVGLVISLWSTLSRTSRFFPSLVFLLATLAVHGAGQYTLRQWKLRTTSRGILHIGLMLIPLAVLVGILLSSRGDDLPRADLTTLVVVAVGAIVYGALAITACKSLFSRSWPIVATLTIVASSTLLPIYFLARHAWLNTVQATWVLLPLVATSLLVAAYLSRKGMQTLVRPPRPKVRLARLRQLAGMVTQSLFATSVAIVFWLIQSKNPQDIPQWWFVAVGLLAAGWAGWGWALSQSPAQRTSQPATRTQESSWLVISAWLVASLASLGLIAFVWQIASDRGPLVSLLLLAGTTWLWQGWLCNVRFTMLAGGLAAVVASGLLLDGTFAHSASLQAPDWLSFSRIATLSGVGLLTTIAAVMGALSVRSDRQAANLVQRRLGGSPLPVASLAAVLEQIQFAGGLAVAIAAALTLVASLLPVGATPYGGNWAALMLLAYGGVAMAAGILFSDWRKRGLLPIGQIILLIGTLRLCQTSPMLDPWLAELRPGYSWPVGLGSLALVWALLGVLLRAYSSRYFQTGSIAGEPGQTAFEGKLGHVGSWQGSIDLLCGGAIFLSLCSAIAFWTRDDQFYLASRLGWLLPLTCLSVFFSWRTAPWRECSLIALCLWALTAGYQLGNANQWWATLGLAGSSAALVLLLTATLACFEWVIGLGSRAGWGKAQALFPNSPTAWLAEGEHNASTSLLAFGWLALCLGMLGPASVHVLGSLGANPELTQNNFLTQSLDASGLALLLTATAALTVTSLWLGRLNKQRLLIDFTSLVSIALACGVAAYVQPPYSLMAGLWLLAGMLLASDGLQFVSSQWQRRSQAAWQQMATPGESVANTDGWLILGRSLGLGLLLMGTLATIVASANRHLPVAIAGQSIDWLSNTSQLLKGLGPALLVALVRWSLSVWNAERPRLISVAAVLAAGLLACVASLAVANAPRLPASAIVFLQCFALSAAGLSWATLGFTGLRNFIGLRTMLGGKLPMHQLIAKSMKGARWQRCEQAAWSLAEGALLALGLLCLGASIVVIAFPAAELRGIDRLGGTAVLLTSVVTLSLMWFLSVRRSFSKFALLALTLGLLAPLATASYTSWLVAVPSRQSVAAAGFEPLRGLLALWLVALATGLGVRLIAWRQGTSLKWTGELAWILLAGLISILATISISQDPNYVWPLMELSGLALIGVMSSVLSGQAWRGHLAAVAAAMGLSVWLVHPTLGLGASKFQELWLVMWGPVWVALLALACQFSLRGIARYGLDKAEHNQPVLAPSTAWRTVDFSTSLLVPLANGVFSFLWLAGQRASGVLPPNATTWWLLGLAIASLCLATWRLWNPQPAKRGLGVYLNLIALALVLAVSLCSLGALPLKQSWLIWLAAGLGAMAVMAALLRELARESATISKQLHLSGVATPSKFQHALRWMPVAHTLASMLALLPCVLLVLAFDERSLRVAATVLPFIGALSILPIAGQNVNSIFRYCGLILTSASILLLWWADLPNAWALAGPSESWIFVQRAFVGFILLGVGYPLLARVLHNKKDWEQPLMDIGWASFFVGLMIGLVMLAGEFEGLWRQSAVEADLLTKILTLGAWTAAVARWLQFAVRPHASDMRASVGLRKAAVFASEAALALLCIACYFHFPDLFAGVLVNWWPIVVFAIAMLSAGLGGWLQRLNQSIVADPIQQSSLLLPIIPLAGVWLFQPHSADVIWHDWGRYALLLLTAAGLYGLHGWSRNSVGLRALSAILALFSFWSFLHSQPNLGFFQHPQFWLLPPALAALLFVEFNRPRLDEAVVVGTRYIALLLAYLSSTSEVFLKAFEGQLWQPLLLLVLSLVGVAAGIILRVRAFLYCGAAFTMVALLGMVWHAQQAIGQVWPWWAFGIATGVGLIVLLGYFEKNRPRVIAYLEQLKQWEQ